MDPRTRQDIAAATAAHRELGPDYADAVAEGLVERIGAEVDRRVDARLAQHGAAAPAPFPQPTPLPQPAPFRQPAPPATAGRSGWPGVVLALGSMLVGLLASLAALKNEPSGNAVGLAVVIWIVIAVINIAYARARRR